MAAKMAEVSMTISAAARQGHNREFRRAISHPKQRAASDGRTEHRLRLDAQATGGARSGQAAPRSRAPPRYRYLRPRRSRASAPRHRPLGIEFRETWRLLVPLLPAASILPPLGS